MFHQHSLSVDFIQYRDRQFIFGFNFERVVNSSYTGNNTRAGQQMLIPNQMYITLLSDQILEIKDLGLKVTIRCATSNPKSLRGLRLINHC